MSKKIRRVSARIKKTRRFLSDDIWEMPLDEIPRGKSFFIRQLRILLLAVRGLKEDDVVMRASALTYFTLFSIVPIAGLAFGIAKGFGMETYLELQLELALTGREEVYDWIIDFSQSMLQAASGGMVAGVGLVVLLYTVMRLLDVMEESFNRIWQVNKPRPWSRKFSDYFSIMFLTPLFFIMSSAVTIFISTQITDFAGNGHLLGFLSSGLLFLVNLIPYVLIWIMLTLLYMIMPYTNVKFSSALIAGIIAGTMFQLMQWGYIYFQVGVSKYNAIYGSFAALPLLLMWIQISWLIVLFGAEIAFATQNAGNYQYDSETKNISAFNRKLLSLYIMQQLIYNFMKGVKPWDSGEIANKLVLPNKLVRSILNDLVAARLLNEARTAQPKEMAYQPAMDINRISIRLVLDRLEHLGDDIKIHKPTRRLTMLNESLTTFGLIIENSEKNLLLKDLARSVKS